jgi:ubiquinone/menaquinone biosynthesis C-methylase UbiE
MDTTALEESVVRSVSGTVLEIGAGSGANFDDFPTDIEWIGLEPDSSVLATLRRRARQFSRSSRVIEGIAERIPLDDASVDTVLSTFVLCSVDDPALALSEIKRVLRPGGRFVFLEHVAAPRGSFTRFAQRMTNLGKRKPGDCDPVRDTLDTIQAAFTETDVQPYSIRGWHTLGFGIPHLAGSASLREPQGT